MEKSWSSLCYLIHQEPSRCSRTAKLIIVFLFKVSVFYIQLRLISDSLREDTECLTLVSHSDYIIYLTLCVLETCCVVSYILTEQGTWSPLHRQRTVAFGASLVHPKIKNVSLFTHPHVTPNQHADLFFWTLEFFNNVDFCTEVSPLKYSVIWTNVNGAFGLFWSHNNITHDV